MKKGSYPNSERYILLSVADFDNICKNAAFTNYIFCTKNQRVKMALDAKLIFSEVIVSINPNTICFKRDDEYFSINMVKYVEYCTQESPLGDVFVIVCDNINRSVNKNTYTIIAR